jgi:hypothetical protein
VGGLYVLGTERHESRRIDNQLRGRAGRQGDPGLSLFYLSLEDDLMRMFASERIGSIMERLKWPEDEAITAKMVTKAVEGAQRQIEELNFERRKNVLKYDDVRHPAPGDLRGAREAALGRGLQGPGTPDGRGRRPPTVQGLAPERSSTRSGTSSSS